METHAGRSRAEWQGGGLTFFSLFVSFFLPSFFPIPLPRHSKRQDESTPRPTELAAEEAGNPDGAGWLSRHAFFALPALFLFFSFFLRRRPFLSRSCQRRGRALLVQAPVPLTGGTVRAVEPLWAPKPRETWRVYLFLRFSHENGPEMDVGGQEVVMVKGLPGAYDPAQVTPSRDSPPVMLHGWFGDS